MQGVIIHLTCLADAQRVLCGVEHLIFVLFVNDLALAQIRRELGRVEDARELVPHALHAIPELLAALFRPSGRGAQLLPKHVRLLCPHCDPLKSEKKNPTKNKERTHVYFVGNPPGSGSTGSGGFQAAAGQTLCVSVSQNAGMIIPA